MRWQRVIVAMALWTGLLFGAEKALCTVGFCQGICFSPCGAGCVCLKRQDIESQGYCFSEQAEKRMLEAGWKLIP